MSHGTLTRFLAGVEAAAPFAAGTLLAATGGLAAAHTLGMQGVPVGPLGSVSLPTALLVAGSGAGIMMASWEVMRLRKAADRAEQRAARSEAERDLSLRQATRLRAQAEGLALMREVHRSTAIPERRDRLHRILTLVGEMFDATEVTLFAALPGRNKQVRPAAYLRHGGQDEVFVAFEVEACEGDAAVWSQKQAVRDASMAWEGCWLFIEGQLWADETQLARAHWRRTTASGDDGHPRASAEDLLTEALENLDYGTQACTFAARALEQGRTLRHRESRNLTRHAIAEDGMVVCVPLMADQRPVGVLRIRRPFEGIDGAETEAYEELLIESAKHIALAMKKDEDDRKAITDQLTNLFIKRHFLAKMEELRTQAAAAGVNGAPFALVLCDIDHFKNVNDTHGHLSGDLVLKKVAQILRGALRAGDMAFRYGGEEMAVLMPGAPQDAAFNTAERLRTAIERTTFLGDKGQPIPITISMGVALHKNGLTGQELIARADQALYASKHGGRNRTTPWTPQLPDPLAEKKKQAAQQARPEKSTQRTPPPQAALSAE